jgi:predicted ATPase
MVEGLARFLERKDLLLVLDNCEHLVGAVAAWVSAATTAAPRLSVLATSREALGVRGEHISPLASLAVPDAADVNSVLTSEAGALFVARADEARGELALDDASSRAVRDLCTRLDGIPLALELAAAQTKLMTPAEILARLDKQFRLLTGGRRTSLERHQTLRAAIDWSYELLREDERALLTRLSVCVGGFDLDAAVAIAAGICVDEFEAFELLASLVAKSLVERSERGGTTRYRLLEMIRQYAAEKLGATDAAEAARDDHARHYLALAVALLAETASPSDYEALDRLEAETPNLAAAGRWLLDADRIPELTAFFAETTFLDPFAWPPTTLDELGAIAGAAVDQAGVVDHPGSERAAHLAGCRAFFTGEIDECRRYAELALGSSGGERVAGVFNMMATVTLFDGDVEQALSIARTAIARARRDDDPAQLAWMIAYTGVLETIRDADRALPLADEALTIARATGSTVALFYPLLAVMAAAAETDPSGALAAAEECMRLDRTGRSTYLNLGRGRAAMIHLARGEIAEALSLWQEILRSYADGGERSVFSINLSSLALSVAPHDPSAAIELAALAESDAITAFASFTTQPELIRLAESHPAEVAAAKQRFEGFGYDEAVEFIAVTLDRLIAEHGSPEVQ